MKKLFATLLAMLMLVSLCCTSALAAGSDTPDKDVEVPVLITMNKDVAHKYQVDIDYPDPLIFTYSTAQNWDPTTYTYKDAEDSTVPTGWSDDKSITIINNSDMPVKFTATAAIENTNYGDLGIELENNEGTIGACTVGMTPGTQNAAFTIGVTGIPTDSLNGQAVRLGSIDISIRNP